jgi:glucose-6-phosphate 1-epimerase
MKRRIRVGKEGSLSTVVWNPWIDKAARMPDFGDDEYPEMVCVETANCGPDTIQLAPGQTHAITARISVAAW